MLGGYWAGALGARLPDVIDPPTHPGHRSIGHSMILSGLVFAKLKTRVLERQAEWRAEAERLRTSRLAARPEAQLGLWLRELWCHFAAGVLAGLVAGWLSHLALDAVTPAGLPLFW